MFKFGTLADAKASGVTNLTVDGQCSNCGSCCSNTLPISSKEVKVIERYIRKHGVKEQRRVLPTADDYVDMSCPFRSETEKKCLIYPVRPAVCREFRCDQSPEKISANKRMFAKRYETLLLRETFYPQD